MRTADTQSRLSVHDRLVWALVRKYEEEGYYVKADHIGHPNGVPPAVNGHVPDIVAYRNGPLVLIAEAEVCEDLQDDHTCEQWQAFSRSPYLFDIIVPKSCYDEARRQAAAWGVIVNAFWWLDI